LFYADLINYFMRYSLFN